MSRELAVFFAVLPLLDALIGLVLTFTIGRRQRSVRWLGWLVAITGLLSSCGIPWFFAMPKGDGFFVELLRLLMIPVIAIIAVTIGAVHFTLFFGQVMLVLLGLTRHDGGKHRDLPQHPG